MSISITETFEWVPLYFKDLMKTVESLHPLDIACVRNVSGWREGKGLIWR